MGVTTADGILVAASMPFEPGTDLSDRKHIADTIRTRDFSAGEYIVGRLSKAESINFTYPVLDKYKNLVAVLCVGFRLDEFARFFARINLPQGFAVNITDYKGVRLHRFPNSDALPPGRPIPGDLYPQV